MPKWMRRWLTKFSLEQHFWIALAGAIGFRFLAAWFVFGPQALDDYKHGVWPAYQFFSHQPLSLPTYRSPLLVWLLASFVQMGSWFRIHSALAQVRTMYLGLGAISLLGVAGTYLYVRL